MIDVAQEPSGFRCVWFLQTLRYSFRHSHFLYLHQSLRSGFSDLKNAPLPLILHQSRASVPGLSLVTLSVPLHSTSELLRTLSRMAASKPTSWLLLRGDSLSH